MSENATCQICGYPNAKKQINHDPCAVFWSCPICGRFELTEKELLNPILNKNLLASFLYYNSFLGNSFNNIEYRYHTTLSKELCDKYTAEFNKGNNIHGHPVHLDNDIINLWYPTVFSEKIDMILKKLNKLAGYIGGQIDITKWELFSLTFVDRLNNIDKKELDETALIKQSLYYMTFLNEAGYIKGGLVLGGDKLSPIEITSKGYERIDTLQKNPNTSREVLIAMKFGEDTLKLREAIKQGISDAGYIPVLIDEVEHNEFITPELLKHIKNSKFVVADLTHQNNGAYFEEGYAMGLGKPVIQLCKKDTKLHFDIAQKNTIMWERESDIPLKLKNRIIATID